MTQELKKRLDRAVQGEYLFIEFTLGVDIKEAAELAWLQSLRNVMGLPVRFKFNGITLTVHKDSRPGDVVLLYHAKMKEGKPTN